MSLLQNLVDSRRRECEAQRRYIAELQALAQRLRGDALRLRPDFGAPGESPAQALAARRLKLQRSIAAIELQIAAAGEALAAAERELRRHETARAQRAAAAAPDNRPRRSRRTPPRAP